MAVFTDADDEQINKNRVAIGKLETTAEAHGEKLDAILDEVRRNGNGGGDRSLKQLASIITGVLIVVGSSVVTIVEAFRP